MINAVLFDLDGTLFDRDSSVRRLVASQWERLGDACARVPLETFVDEFIARDARGYVRKEVVYEGLLQAFAIPDVAATTLYQDFFARYHDDCLLFPSAREALEALGARGLRLGIITNGGSPFQLRTVQALGIEAYFSVILISGAEGIKKPDPRIFHRAVSQLGVAPAETVFVGDHPVVDVEGARNAGLRAVWKHDPFWSPPTMTDGVITDLHQLPDLIRAIEDAG